VPASPFDEVAFEDVWARRQILEYAPGVPIVMPSVEDHTLVAKQEVMRLAAVGHRAARSMGGPQALSR